MWPALGRWHGDGAWAKYFDNAADGDDLHFQDWQVIDLAGAAEHEDLCEAALFYTPRNGCVCAHLRKPALASLLAPFGRAHLRVPHRLDIAPLEDRRMETQRRRP